MHLATPLIFASRPAYLSLPVPPCFRMRPSVPAFAYPCTTGAQETVTKLIEVFRYPEELRQLDFQWDYMTKGLIIDKVQTGREGRREQREERKD